MAHTTIGGKIYADTDFLNKCQRVKGVELKHMGFGEFYAETPKGRVDFDRMRGKDFEGQSGRSHEVYGDGAKWLVKETEKAKLSEKVASGKRDPLQRRIIDILLEVGKRGIASKSLYKKLKAEDHSADDIHRAIMRLEGPMVDLSQKGKIRHTNWSRSASESRLASLEDESVPVDKQAQATSKSLWKTLLSQINFPGWELADEDFWGASTVNRSGLDAVWEKRFEIGPRDSNRYGVSLTVRLQETAEGFNADALMGWHGPGVFGGRPRALYSQKFSDAFTGSGRRWQVSPDLVRWVKANFLKVVKDIMVFVQEDIQRANATNRLASLLEEEGILKAADEEGVPPQPGDILYSSWGYDQTNIDFYEVVGLTKTMVAIRQLDSKIVRSSGQSDYVMPVPGRYAGKVKRRKTRYYRGKLSLSLNSYSVASPWSGKPMAQTNSLYGH